MYFTEKLLSAKLNINPMALFYMLHRLFASPETVLKDLEKNNEKILKEWEAYVNTLLEKNNIIHQPIPDIAKLLELIKEEIKDISLDEKSEEEVINDLESMGHRYRIRKIHRLEQTLFYSETKYKYIYELLKGLYHALRREMHIAVMLEKKEGDPKIMIEHLRKQIQVEMSIGGKIKNIYDEFGPKKFEGLFLEIVKQEHIIHELTEDEKKIIKRMEKVFNNTIPGSVIDKWIGEIYGGLQDKLAQLHSAGLIDAHRNADFEFVNSSKFVDYVRDTLRSLKKREVSEDWIKSFVHLFREDFNSVYKNYPKEF